MWGKPVFSGWDKFGTLISKFEDKWWDIDIKNITVSHCDHTKCTRESERKFMEVVGDKNYENPKIIRDASSL